MKNLRKSYLWCLLDLLSHSVDFHLLETNDELCDSLSLCNRQLSHAVWYSYSLFHEKNCCSVREMWQGECIRCVIGMLHSVSGLICRTAYLQTFRNTEQIPHFTVCATDTKHAQLPKNTLLLTFAMPIEIDWWQLFRDTDRSDSVRWERPLVELFVREIHFRGDYPAVEALRMVSIWTVL